MSVSTKIPTELMIDIYKRLDDIGSIAECSLVCKQWYLASRNESLWLWFIERRLIDKEAIKEMLCTKENNTNSNPESRVTNYSIYKEWYCSYIGYHDTYTNMRRNMRKLKEWSDKNCPKIYESLNPGLKWRPRVSFSSSNGSSKKSSSNGCDGKIPLNELMQYLPWSDPRLNGFIMAYHLHDGQRFHFSNFSTGLFGTFRCLDRPTSLIWLQSSSMLQFTVVGQIQLLVFAWCRRTLKYLALVTGCRSPKNSAILHHVVRIQSNTLQYTNLGTFEEFYTRYVHDLVSGRFDVLPANQIVMMPNWGNGTSHAITKGISVSFSIIFCPEENSFSHTYKYRVKLELKDPQKLRYPSVQLLNRCWAVQCHSNEEHRIFGEGVVGLNPILSIEAPTFSYFSQIQDNPHDHIESMCGYFEMIPGTITNPLGPSFNIEVAPVKLRSLGVNNWK